MANYRRTLGRREIIFTDHALDRWWQRCEENEVKGRRDALRLLDSAMEHATWRSTTPDWAGLSIWNLARAEGFVHIDENSGFVVNRNPNGDRVAVTYIEKGYKRLAA
jgi:hypothetical protein